MLSGLIRLPVRDKSALVRVAATLMLVRAGLAAMPADRLARLLGVPLDFSDREAAPPAARDSVPAGRRRQIHMLDALLSHRPFRSPVRCLEQSLTVAVILRPAAPRLRIGVARDGHNVMAHAWVEAAGRSFLAQPAFVPLAASAGADR